MRSFIIVLIAVGFYCYRTPFFHLINPSSYSVSLPAKLDGALAPNTKLEDAEKLYENNLNSPEALVDYNGKIYTGLADGRIVEVSTQKVIDVSHNCDRYAGSHDEHKCGRPLGMAFSKSGNLYVVDAYYGLLSVDIKTGKRANILTSDTIVDGFPLTFLNNVAFDEKQQVLYFTQSSTKWNVSEVAISLLEHEASGRVLKHDLKTKKTTVLLKDLSMANGIELTHDGQALLIAILNDHKIIKYFIHGAKKGTHSFLPAIFPGEVDNISRSKRGTYWVGIENGRSLESLFFFDKLAEHPIARKIVIFAHKIISTPVAAIMQLLPYDWVKEMAFEIQTGRIAADFLKSYGIIVEFDDTGKILRSFHSPSGKISHISDVLEHNGYLYLGSWKNRYIGRLKL